MCQNSEKYFGIKLHMLCDRKGYVGYSMTCDFICGYITTVDVMTKHGNVIQLTAAVEAARQKLFMDSFFFMLTVFRFT
jgi:hypothetical protein